MGVEEAIKLATETVVKLFGGSDHRLEEVEVKDDGAYEVTVSYHSPDSPRLVPLRPDSLYAGLQGATAAIGVDVERTYKDVLVKDGQVKAVRMRQIVVG